MRIGDRDQLSDHRVVIVGAGPAGSSSAILCAKLGFGVTLLETEGFPRSKPGEALHPGVDVIFRELGVYDAIQKANFIRHYGIAIKLRYNENPIITQFGEDNNEPWLGYQAFRSELDNILLAQAHALGVMVIQPCSARKILVESDRVIGVKNSCGSEVLADFVIDATGERHWLVKKLDLTIEKYSSPLYV